MKKIESVEEIAELPGRSVVVLAGERHGWLSTSVYQKLGRDSWLEMDPGDRYDGEHTWPDASILVIAGRDEQQAYLAFDPRELEREPEQGTDAEAQPVDIRSTARAEAEAQYVTPLRSAGLEREVELQQSAFVAGAEWAAAHLTEENTHA